MLAKSRLRTIRFIDERNEQLAKEAAPSTLIKCPDPVEFARKYLNIEPWGRQAEILRAAAEQPKVAVRSGHKIGKSTSCAILALWWFATLERAFVIMTSSGDDQVRLILWPEVQRLYRLSGGALGGTLHQSHRTGLVAPDGRMVVGLATDKTERMGGYSGKNLRFIVDEASGVDEGIFNAIDGNSAGGAHQVLFGNPTRMTGRLFDAFHSKAQFWHLIHVSSTETPNAISGEDTIPGLATKSWIEKMAAEHGGPGNSEYDIRVAGNFPGQGKNSVIGLTLVEEAQKGWRMPVPEDGPLEIGVDVARFGDDETVIQARRGLFCYPALAIKHKDGFDVAGAVLELVRKWRVDAPPLTYQRGPGYGERPVRGSYEIPKVKIDALSVGASPLDVLRRSEEVITVAVTVSESATDEAYYRLRDQLWFAAATWLKEGGKFQPDSMLRAELIAPSYSFEARGRKKVQSKDEIKKLLTPHRSPDRADALCLAVYSGVSFASGPAGDGGFVDW